MALAFALLGGAGAAAYQLLSSAPQLPPLGDALAALGGGGTALVGGAAAAAGALKLALGDRFHLELHRGRLYATVGVPSQGPPLAAGAVVVRPTGNPRLGNGAYAAAPIPAGTHIADYSGERLGRAAFFERYPDGVGDFSMALDDEWVLDAAADVADTSRFHAVHMNHSRGRANVARYYHRAAGRVAFFASRDIAAGEELLYDYGRAYWRCREGLELP
ncbi:MAG: hypothetical protein J3K34DRAFT_522495 [Monoraphidium minutum]|nr:MAG: hypothetical protein J3K34DRAFT_522495 [Monoraphidium minutum]